MKYRMLCVLLAVVITSGWLSGCSSNGDKTNEQPEQAANSQQSDGTGSGTGDTITVDLLHTYTTRFGEVNQLTYPRFSFDYPDNWKITSEEVTEIAEEVTLTNDTGITVTYWNFHGMRDLTGPTRDMNRVDVTRAADASFVPGYVQATDYSDLGAFMVGKLKTVGNI